MVPSQGEYRLGPVSQGLCVSAYLCMLEESRKECLLGGEGQGKPKKPDFRILLLLGIPTSEFSSSSLFCSQRMEIPISPSPLRSGYKISPLYFFSTLNRNKSFDKGEGCYKE